MSTINEQFSSPLICVHASTLQARCDGSDVYTVTTEPVTGPAVAGVVGCWSSSAPLLNVIDQDSTDLSDPSMSWTAWTTATWTSSSVGSTDMVGMLSDTLQRNNGWTLHSPSASAAETTNVNE